MAPFFVLQFLSVRATAWSVAIPMLAQYQLLERATLGEAIPRSFILLSVGGTLLCALLLLILAVHLYTRERVLG